MSATRTWFKRNTVNAVAPKQADTDMTKVLKDDLKDKKKQEIPRRLGEAKDNIICCILASDNRLI